MSRAALFLLGPPRIERDGEPVEVDTRKAIALAAYLSISGEEHSRDALAAIFWPLSNQSRARAALRRTLSTLRRAVGDEKLDVDGERLALRPSSGFQVDVDQFLRLLADCETHGHRTDQVCPACVAPLSQAVALYHADFMSGFTLRDSPGFDEWQTFQTESLRLELAWALERLVQRHCETQEFDPGIAYARRWMALDPMHDQPHYALMQMYTWTGQRSAALRQYQEYVQILEQELGVPPEQDITQLYETVRENHPLPLPSPSLTGRSHNLPLQATPFVGREDELREVGQLLARTSCRLLTISGPGGVGKTRLGLQVAAGRVQSFSDGVFFVPLAHLRSPDLLVPAIAESLGFSFRGRADPKAQLLDYLRDKETLLLLDNFEQFLAPPTEAAASPQGETQGEEGDPTGFLVELLSNVPRVKLVVTSRERLNLKWEWPYEIGGLPFPRDSTDDTVEDYGAAQLFLHSARRAHPGFSLSEAEKPFLIRICQSLEGMPLGIELAAAWVEVSSCQQIAQEIERNLNFLTTSRRDVPERHRSLQAAFEHSWRLLSPGERDVLSKLSVFRGGLQRQAAEYVTDASLMHLSTFMHKSLLRRTPTGRYEMLEVLRQHAADKLREAPQRHDETHSRHCEFYAGFLSQREELLESKQMDQVLDEIGAEIDNVRAAWRWAVAHHQREQIEKFLPSLYRFYETRSWFLEGEEALRQAAATLSDGSDAVRDPLLVKLRTRQGWFCLKLSRFEEGQELLEASLAASRQLDMPRDAALALNHLGVAAAWLGDFDRAAEFFEESITISSRIDDPIGMAKSLNNIGIVAKIQERYREAKLLLQESLSLYAKSENLAGVVYSLTNLGHVAEALGDLSEAKAFHHKCLGINIEIGDRWGMANSLCNLGFILCALHERSAAQICFQESLGIASDLQSIDLILENLVGIATLASKEGRTEQAVEVVACVLHHPAVAGQAKERAEELLSDLESRMSSQAFAIAQARGKGKDIQQVARVYGAGQLTT
jgi:DNA-binding SARP family transcriptional activator/predicted ATPase